MVAVDIVSRYESLLNEFKRRIRDVGLFALDADLERMDAELIDLERRLPASYRQIPHSEQDRETAETP